QEQSAQAQQSDATDAGTEKQPPTTAGSESNNSSQSVTPPQGAPASARGVIVGIVKSGNMPMPGVTVTAANSLSGQKLTTWTDVNGHYSFDVPGDGRYVIRAQMAAFAAATGEALIKGDTRAATIDLEMVLQSRAQQQNTSDQQRLASALNRGFQSLSVLQG